MNEPCPNGFVHFTVCTCAPREPEVYRMSGSISGRKWTLPVQHGTLTLANGEEIPVQTIPPPISKFTLPQFKNGDVIGTASNTPVSEGKLKYVERTEEITSGLRLYTRYLRNRQLTALEIEEISSVINELLAIVGTLQIESEEKNK